MLTRQPRHAARAGAAAVELAILLPLLCFFFVIGVDFARIFYFTVTVANCARNGALYGSIDLVHSQDTAGIQSAALADAANISPAPTVSSTTGVDASGNPYVEVTVGYRFYAIVRYPGVPEAMDITRTLRMRVVPEAPDEYLGS